MKDIPEDVMQAAYEALANAGFRKGTKLEIAAVVVSQAVVAERERATAHARDAKEIFRNSADGSAALEVVAASSLFELVERNIRDGVPA